MDQGRTLFVTRHPGALEWLQEHHPQLAASAEAISHLSKEVITSLKPWDVVIGVLPVAVAADVCARGARFIALELRVPPELRGQELTAEQMSQLGASLVEFRVERVITL